MGDEMQEADLGKNDKTGPIAIIFISQRNSFDHSGYSNAADTMEALAKKQPGYAGIVSVRDPNGLGITVSYWDNEVAAKAWRAHPVHTEVRDNCRVLWYDSYHVDVAKIERSYDWARNMNAVID